MALKVLLADDSMTAQNMGKKILTDAGFDVATVSNGAAALKKVAEYKPNIIILDIYMPGYTGLEVCERVRATDTATPILLTVGKLEPFRQEDVDNVHADAIIVKPFEATDLINTVQRFAGQAHVAASKAAVPPPPPVVELPPPPPPAQLSEEDLAFLRGEIVEQAPPEPQASNAGAAAVTNPDFADLLAAPQAPVTPAEGDIALNDFELPPLTEADFSMLQDEASVAAAPAAQEMPLAEPAALELEASSPVLPEPVVEISEPMPAAMPAFQLDESVEPAVETADVFETAPTAEVELPTQFAVAEESAAPVPEVAMAAAAAPIFESPTSPVEHTPAFVPEPAFTVESQPAADEFALELPAEADAPVTAEPLIEPILETAPAAADPEAAEPELEPLELEQSGPQPTTEAVAPPEELAPAYEFIGATGHTPADLEIEAVPVESVLEAEPAEFAQTEPVLDLADPTVPASEASLSAYAAAPELLENEAQSFVASTETAAPVGMDLNYATVAGVVHRVFDRYKSQMIADIVRELSQRK